MDRLNDYKKNNKTTFENDSSMGSSCPDPRGNFNEQARCENTTIDCGSMPKAPPQQQQKGTIAERHEKDYLREGVLPICDSRSFKGPLFLPWKELMKGGHLMIGSSTTRQATKQEASTQNK
eukprot:scaffold9523_cov103-Cylindrotheca_fusiformis.AAC.16